MCRWHELVYSHSSLTLGNVCLSHKTFYSCVVFEEGIGPCTCVSHLEQSLAKRFASVFWSLNSTPLCYFHLYCLHFIQRDTFCHHRTIWLCRHALIDYLCFKVQNKMYRMNRIWNLGTWNRPRCWVFVSCLFWYKIGPCNVLQIQFVDTISFWTGSCAVVLYVNMWVSRGFDIFLRLQHIAYNLSCLSVSLSGLNPGPYSAQHPEYPH